MKAEGELNDLLEKKVTKLIKTHGSDVELAYIHQVKRKLYNLFGSRPVGALFLLSVYVRIPQC